MASKKASGQVNRNEAKKKSGEGAPGKKQGYPQGTPETAPAGAEEYCSCDRRYGPLDSGRPYPIRCWVDLRPYLPANPDYFINLRNRSNPDDQLAIDRIRNYATEHFKGMPIEDICECLDTRLRARCPEATDEYALTLQKVADLLCSPFPPEDDSAFRPATDLLRAPYDSIRAINAVLKQHPEIRRYKPSPQRLKIHAGDWHGFLATSPTDSIDQSEEAISLAIAKAHEAKANKRGEKTRR
jgi:hypothetical protein